MIKTLVRQHIAKWSLFGDTLINEFTPDEIETVLAYELGHQVHKDIPLLIGLGTLTTLMGFYLVLLALHWVAGAFLFDGPADIAGLPAFILVLGAYGLLTMPLENAFSRWHERMADEYSLRITGKKRKLLPQLSSGWRIKTCLKSTRRPGWYSCSMTTRL